MKKIIVSLLVLVLAMGIVGCNKDNAANNTASTGGTAEGTTTIGFVVSTQTNPFFVTLKEGAEAKAKELGVELIVLDAQDDSTKAASNMEDLITRGVDVIVVNPTDSDAIVPSVEAANEAGIPVITVDRVSNGGEVVSSVASDNIAGGKMAGEFIIEKLAGKGKVVELEGISGANSAIERGQGFNEAIEGSGLEVVAKQTADYDRSKGLEVMENILQSQPEIDAVFAHNDEMALGALEAIKAAGRDIIVVGFDATDDAVASVEAGDLAATIAQQPDIMGQKAIEIAQKVANGEEVEASIPVELKMVTK
ncbi:ribose ABC transporter substrate-binding protein RbsB [Peptoniphilus obesi]|uniref:ribose ABC transporter substrate-binding protein RbsB n=1 Tax=Peptoniphilus obesi TaxID=1472765 RepID=UPI0004ACF259|nr:ribose ABC transporter substrate-binding protein RbsB [Peptoniphilus obesi]